MKGGAANYRYEIRVEQHIGTAVAGHFPEFTLTLNDDGSSTLCGDLPDQAALHGVLARIRDLGLILLVVRRLPLATTAS